MQNRIETVCVAHVPHLRHAAQVRANSPKELGVLSVNDRYG